VVDVLGQRAFVVFAGLDAAVGNESEGAALLEGTGCVTQALGLEEALLRGLGLAAELDALVELGDQDVPAAHAHQHQDDQGAARHEVALLPESTKAVGVVDRLLGGERSGHRSGCGGSAGVGCDWGSTGGGGCFWCRSRALGRGEVRQHRENAQGERGSEPGRQRSR